MLHTRMFLVKKQGPRCCGKQFWAVPQRARHPITTRLVDSTPGVSPRDLRAGPPADTGARVPSSSVCDSHRQPAQCPAADEWGHDSACPYHGTAVVLERNEIPTHATARMNPENAVLSERSLTPEDECRVVPLP